MLHHVVLVRIDVSEEHSASIIRVARIDKQMAFFIVTTMKTSNLT
jgi:hypothetical protein